uniref:C-type lectin domain-containing protein n=1 Tax=Esox lucius TaxID=8010 RepID=A0AAY5K8F0_ESOLU
MILQWLRPTVLHCFKGHCLTLGANLVSVHSPEESHFLLQLTDGSPAWVGGSDAVQNRQWFWSDGSTFGYQNWAKGEPNNFNSTREPCIEMNYGILKGCYFYQNLQLLNVN